MSLRAHRAETNGVLRVESTATYMSWMRCSYGVDMEKTQGLDESVAKYLKKHPEIAEALQVLELSASQYGRTLNRPRIIVTDKANSVE